MVLPSVSSRAFGLTITAASTIRWTFCSVLSVARNGSCLQNSTIQLSAATSVNFGVGLKNRCWSGAIRDLGGEQCLLLCYAELFV